ncbi:uncharacterized protein SCHCODRAFT_01119300, partial [Schizophyllum commune H4-8]|uniref:uncharacterized protein n=1 Tax=Schizophyllum commune (strain H4-8 / FGSC 9210) TaxID=578458 RepID=UPI00215E83F5
MLPQSTLRRYTVDEESDSPMNSPAATADDATAFAIDAAPSMGDAIPPGSIGDANPTTTAAATSTNEAIPATISAAPSATETTPTTTDATQTVNDAAPTTSDAAPTPNKAAPTTIDTTSLTTDAPPPALTLHTPAQITALALVPHDICADTLIAGSADGTLRVYDLTHGKVLRAVRGLGDEVASIAIVVPDKKGKDTGKDKGKGTDKDKGKGADTDKGKGADKESSLRAWVACGRKVLHFDLSPSAPMLQTAKDAAAAVDVCEEDEGDAVNGLALLPRGTHLAFCTDAGAVGVLEVDKVGVLDIDPGKIRRLRGRHSNLASTLHPVPH